MFPVNGMSEGLGACFLINAFGVSSAINLPLSMIAIRSQRYSASSILCVVKTIVIPEELRSLCSQEGDRCATSKQ